MKIMLKFLNLLLICMCIYFGYTISEKFAKSDEIQGEFILSDKTPYQGPFKFEGIKNDTAVLSTGQEEKKIYTLTEGESITFDENDSKTGSVLVKKITNTEVVLNGKVTIKKDFGFRLMQGVMMFMLAFIYTLLKEDLVSLYKTLKQKTGK